MNEENPETSEGLDGTDATTANSEWVSIGNLLRRMESHEPVPVDRMATALETFSCYEIDKFGRQVKTKENERVLNLVAQWNELENGVRLAPHPDTDPDWILEALERFGWPRANLPDFESMTPGDEEPLGDTERRRMQRAIMGLVALLVSNTEADYKVGDRPNISSIVGAILVDIALRTGSEKVPGYGESTLSGVISAAVKACDKELNIEW